MVKSNKSVFIALTSVLGSMAFILSLAKPTHIPFPILPFLKFDPSEIPSILAFYILGFSAAIAVATIHFLGLAITGAVIGGSMKYLAVVSTIVGLLIASKISKKAIKLHLTLAALVRVGVMSIANYILVALLFPQYLSFSEKYLKNVSISGNVLLDMLIYVAIFNIIHVFYSIIPAIIIIKYITKHVKEKIES